MSDIVNNKIEDYIRKNSSKEPEILKDLNKETYLKVLNPRMLSGHIQGRFLSIITKLIKPKKIPDKHKKTRVGKTQCMNKTKPKQKN